MAVIYTPLNPTLLENTTMQKVTINGVDKLYEITPVEGYVLHDNRSDDCYDAEGNPLEAPLLGYSAMPSTCTIAQFNNNDFELYVVPRDSVPSDRIWSETEKTGTE